MKVIGCNKLIITLFACLIIMTGLSHHAYAQTTIKVPTINKTLVDISTSDQTNADMAYNRLKTKLEGFVNDYKSAKLLLESQEDERQTSVIFLDALVRAIATERVKSQTLASQIRYQMVEDANKSFSGNDEIEDGNSQGSTDNPFSDISVANKAKLQKIFNKYFCNPQSKNASADCQASKVTPSKENFVDFFVGTGTWADKTVLDVLTLARGFYAGMSDKVMLGQGSYDPSTFFSNLGGIARANLRMSIINDLAAQRAPSSEATAPAEYALLKVLVPSGEVTSLNYQTACSDSNQRTMAAYYACSMTAPPLSDKGDSRLISQTALNRILQFDYMLSSDFYRQINSPALSATGGVDKVAVYLKAQQLAQEYRALRLLQMKVAATAVNMINGK
jgi:hypothetical protein